MHVQAVFTTGEETARKDDISAAIEDMIYFVQHRRANR
jgi:hypothetical protein